jgi:hypothetical protein
MNSSAQAKSVELEEGKYTVGFRSADGKSTVQEVFVDGTHPVSALRFLTAPKFEQGKTLWFGKQLSIELTATDGGSGILQTVFAINDNPAASYSSPIGSFTKDGVYELTYHSVDKVGNREPQKKQLFSVDVTGPVLDYAFKGPRYQNFLGPDAEIVVIGADAGSGVQKILYKAARRTLSLYRTAIQADSLKDGSYTLTAVGMDLVENAGDSLRVPFFVDKTPPVVSSEIEGQQTVREGVVFIRSASRVKLNSRDDGAGNAIIRYTIDDQPEIEYRQPFVVSVETGGAVIEYSGTDRIGNTSDKKSLRVFVDETAPVTTFDFPAGYFKEGNDLIITKGSYLQLEAGDLESGVKTIEYRLEKELWKTYENPVSWDKTGRFVCEVRATDMLGNIEPAQKLIVRVQDKVAAVSGADNSAKVEKIFREDQQGLTGAGDLPFYLWISDKPDGSGFQLLLGGPGTAQHVKTVNPFSVKEEGSTMVKVTMPGQSSTSVITLDKTPAKAVLKTNDAPKFEANGKTFFSNALDFQLLVSDNISGPAGIMVSEDGGRFAIGKTAFRNYTSERQYSVRYFGVDKVGNAGEIQEFTFIIDATPPKTQHKLVKNFAGNTLSPETVLELAASDNLAGIASIKYRIDNTAEKVYNGQIRIGDLAGLTDGPHVLYYRSTDNVQNREAERQFAFKYDSRKPELELILEGRSFEKDQRVFVAAGARAVLRNPDPRKEMRSIWFAKNDGERQEYTSPVPLDGSAAYTFSFGAEDVLGNRMPAGRRTVIPDGTAPATSHSFQGTQIMGGDGVVITGPATQVIISANDDASGVRSVSWRLAGQSWKSVSGPFKIDVSGKIELQYQASDQVGNSAEVKSVMVLNDLSVPELEISASPAGRVLADGKTGISTTTAVVVAAKDGLTDVKAIVYRINDGPEIPYVRPVAALPKGVVKFSVSATDLVGNVKTETRTYVVE